MLPRRPLLLQGLRERRRWPECLRCEKFARNQPVKSIEKGRLRKNRNILENESKAAANEVIHKNAASDAGIRSGDLRL
jgi:hypothetical protein